MRKQLLHCTTILDGPHATIHLYPNLYQITFVGPICRLNQFMVQVWENRKPEPMIELAKVVPIYANVAQAKVKVEEAAKMQLCGIEIEFLELCSTPLKQRGPPSLVTAYLYPGSMHMCFQFVWPPYSCYIATCSFYLVHSKNSQLIIPVWTCFLAKFHVTCTFLFSFLRPRSYESFSPLLSIGLVVLGCIPSYYPCS